MGQWVYGGGEGSKDQLFGEGQYSFFKHDNRSWNVDNVPCHEFWGGRKKG